MSKRKPDPKSPARNKLRLQQHKYGQSRRGYGKGYTSDEIKFFLEHNRKHSNGRYEHSDVQIAQIMATSLATIQYLRRKFNMILRLKITEDRVVEYMALSEKALSQIVHEFSREKA